MDEYDLIFCVFGCDSISKYKDEIHAINETWGKKCELYPNIKLLFFLGEKITETSFTGPNYIHLNDVKDDYLSASYKQFLGLNYIYENYKTKFVMCFGTDTYINIPILLLFIKKFNHNDNLYIGGHGSYTQINNKSVYFHSGGPGFILSYTCLHKIKPILPTIMNEWTRLCNEYKCTELIPACDVSIAYFLQKPNIDSNIIVNNDVFFNCNHKGYADNYTYNCCSNKIKLNEIVSVHNMRINDFHEFTKILVENSYFDYENMWTY